MYSKPEGRAKGQERHNHRVKRESKKHHCEERRQV